jgi:hypothetical protein
MGQQGDGEQKPTAATSVVSGRPSLRTARTPRGTTTRPTPISTTRNSSSFAVVIAIVAADTPAPDATAVRVAIRKMAMRSSTMRTPTTNSRRLPLTRYSSKVRAMMVVDEMATTTPQKTLSRSSSRRPARP